jgi:transposase
VARFWDIGPQTLYYWYRNYLSDYNDDTEQGKWKPNKIVVVDETTGEVMKEQPVYVYKPENIGEQMSIDDKALGHDGFTIMSNTQTGKIAMMIESTKCEEVEAALALFDKDLEKVKSISCDMSPTYLKACREKLPQAQRVIDKFHVMQYVYDAVAEVRLRIKKELTEQLSKGKQKTEKDKEILSDLEKLRRCRHLLSQSVEKWSEAGKELVYQIFEKHSELKTAYHLSQDFKRWYNINNPFKYRIYIEKDLFDWYDKVEKAKIKEFNQVVKMIEKHETEIINFFNLGHTNAKAERLNGKIQRFVSNNYGMKDKDFALYRIAGYFS